MRGVRLEEFVRVPRRMPCHRRLLDGIVGHPLGRAEIRSVLKDWRSWHMTKAGTYTALHLILY